MFTLSKQKPVSPLTKPKLLEHNYFIYLIILYILFTMSLSYELFFTKNGDSQSCLIDRFFVKKYLNDKTVDFKKKKYECLHYSIKALF